MNRDRVIHYYVWLTVLAAVVVLFYCVSQVTAAQFDLRYFLIAFTTVLLSSRISITIPNASGNLTISDTFIFLVMLLYGRELAVFVAAAEGGYSTSRYGRKADTVAFNVATMGLSTFLSATAVQALYGPVELLPHPAQIRGAPPGQLF